MIYVLELYDIANDVREPIAYSDNELKLRKWALPIEHLMKLNMVYYTKEDGTKEQYNTCVVRTMAQGENRDMIGLHVFI